jgi:hypothetical protein
MSLTYGSLKVRVGGRAHWLVRRVAPWKLGSSFTDAQSADVYLIDVAQAVARASQPFH